MRIRIVLFSLLGLLLIAGCTNSSPIDTSNPVDFKHHTGVFTLQVPKSWKQAQDQVPTESIAAFSDPTQHAEIIAYAGLLDHRLADAEWFTTVSGLVGNLLNRPTDLQFTDNQHRTDGAFVVSFSFTRSDQKRVGQAIMHDTDLALSGVIADGPEQGWTDLAKALQPYVDSFELHPDFVQGTYFEPLQDTFYAVVVPPDWARQKYPNGVGVKSRSGRMSILTVQRSISPTLQTLALSDQAAAVLRQTFGISAQASASENLVDGRLKITFDQPDHTIIGYVENKDEMFIGLYFELPADQTDAYQPFIDFVYSTLVTGKS